MVNHGPPSEPIAPPPSAEEAAAIVAAMERFARSTAAPGAAVEPHPTRGSAPLRSRACEREPGDLCSGPLDKYLKAARL